MTECLILLLLSDRPVYGEYPSLVNLRLTAECLLTIKKEMNIRLYGYLVSLKSWDEAAQRNPGRTIYFPMCRQ